MGRRIASGQITIVDLNDGKAIQAYTIVSQGETQIYAPDTKTYTPDYTVSPFQVATAKVYVTGNSTDQAPTAACSGWEWKVDGVKVDSTTVDLVASGNTLTIKKNIPTGGQFINIEWSCVYKDPTTQTNTIVQGTKTLNLTKSGGSMGIVRIETPNGNTFDAGTANITTLTAIAKLFKGATHDTTINAMSWERLDISTGQWKPVDAASVSTDVSGGVSTLTVTADDVLNFQTFRCNITDKENDQVGETFSEIVTFFDMTDPYVVEVYTLTGDKILNHTGSTTVYARVWLDGEEVEDSKTVAQSAAKFEYTWTKYSQDGSPSDWHGVSPASNVKKGLTCEVKAEDVTGRATIICEVSKK